MKKYLIIVEETDTGYSAYSPDVPGCGSTGKTGKKSANNSTGHRVPSGGLRTEGYDIPEPSSYSTYVEVAA